ncbi:hypothetical protein ACHAXS_014287 [Conticribra weissflogii]
MKNGLLLILLTTCHPRFPSFAFSAQSSMPSQRGRSTAGEIQGKLTANSPQPQRQTKPIPLFSSTKYDQVQQDLDDYLYSDLENEINEENTDVIEALLSEDANLTIANLNAMLENEDLDNEENDADVGGEDTINPKRLIQCSAKITLPFSAEVAFEAFSDLTRQPSWCNYLHSVEYLGPVDENYEDERLARSEIPLRQSKWTVGVKGLKFSELTYCISRNKIKSWTARDTFIQPPHRIEWQSTSGMKNMGSVEFMPNNNSGTTGGNSTEMVVSFSFVAPRVVASLFRRSNRIRKFTEDVLLMNMLTGFRDVVVEEDL